MVKVGDTIGVQLSISTSSEERHRFFIGTTIRHVDSNLDFDLPLKNFVRGGESGLAVTFKWLVPSNAPKGNYSVISAVWENASNGIPSSRLTDRTVPNAFELI